MLYNEVKNAVFMRGYLITTILITRDHSKQLTV